MTSPSGAIPERWIGLRSADFFGRVRGYNVEVWTEINTRGPTAGQVRIPQSVVSSLRFR
jgi:hypothetical protein